MSDNQDQETPNQPRQPRNVQDVLRYAIEAGNNSITVPPDGQDMAQLDEDRRRFLDGAINSLTVDVVKVLVNSLDVLKSLTNDSLGAETYENALDVIAEQVDNMDAANDYAKLGGFEIVNSCLQSQHSGIRWRIADIVAQCTQNNPFCQNHALNLRLLEPLIAIVDKDTDERCKTKAFFAISNIVRDSQIGMKEFMRVNGFAVVKKAMQSNNDRLRNKSAFFFSSAASNNPNIIWDVVSMGFVELLITLLQTDIGPSHEFVALSLLELARQNAEALTICKKKDHHLEEILTRIINDESIKESYTELVETSRELLKMITAA